jgi:hypothetical protein
MDTDKLEIMRQIAEVFMPYATARRKQLVNHNVRLVHCTSAENAIKILYSKQVWMRNAKCMADYMEISHGHQMLLQFFSQPEKRSTFCKALNGCYADVGEEALQLFDQWWRNNIQFEIYVTSISEHDDSEDVHGRLSMWRGFGRVPAARAPIVMKVPMDNSAIGL